MDTKQDDKKEFLTLRISRNEYNRLCKLIERDEKNRTRAREKFRAKKNSDSPPREAYVKPIKFKIVN